MYNASMARPKKYIREEVIEIAMETFWLKGYAATSLSDLTEKTGLNKKSLYNEFGSKEELFNIALEHYNMKRLPLIQLLQREPLGAQNIIDFLEKLANDSGKKGCLLSLSINERDLLEEDAYKSVKNDFQGLRKLLEMNLSAEYDDKSKVSSLGLLISSQIFSVAGLGKLKVDKKDIKNSIGLIVDQVLRA